MTTYICTLYYPPRLSPTVVFGAKTPTTTVGDTQDPPHSVLLPSEPIKGPANSQLPFRQLLPSSPVNILDLLDITYFWGTSKHTLGIYAGLFCRMHKLFLLIMYAFWRNTHYLCAHAHTHIRLRLYSTLKLKGSCTHVYICIGTHAHSHTCTYTHRRTKIHRRTKHIYVCADTFIHPRRWKTSSVGQSAGLLIPRSSVRFQQKLTKPENSNLHGFELHRPSSKSSKLLLQVINAIINQSLKHSLSHTHNTHTINTMCVLARTLYKNRHTQRERERLREGEG